jgi:hypothetical protein
VAMVIDAASISELIAAVIALSVPMAFAALVKSSANELASSISERKV